MASLLHVCCEGCGCRPVLPISVDEFTCLKKHHPEIVKEFLQFKICFVFCRAIDGYVMFQSDDSKVEINQKGGVMAKKKRQGNGRKGKGNHPGRPSMCEKIPGEGACIKQLTSTRPRICRNCKVQEILTVWIKVFGR